MSKNTSQEKTQPRKKTKEKEQKKETKKEASHLIKQLNEYKGLLQRLQAEFENFKKRNEKENQKFKEQANAQLIKEFLPVLDSFEQALKSEENEGLKQLYAQFKQVLKKNGLQIVNTNGEFNPEYHDCLLHAFDESKPDDFILEELQKGYLLKDLVLRPAKVKINKKNDGQKE